LLTKINTRYGLVITTAKRARLVMMQEALANTKQDTDDDSVSRAIIEQSGKQREGKKNLVKPVTKALQEIADNKITCRPRFSDTV